MASTAKIFVSYSRKDLALVDRLDASLTDRGFKLLIDRSEIYAFEDWWVRIQALITQADTVVFVLSPDAVGSEICRREVAFAASLNKRFAPVVARRVADAAVPPELARLNFVFLDDEAEYEAGADRLAAALSTDIGWIRRHTELGEIALRWEAAGRPAQHGLLLRPPILEEAEAWIAGRPDGAPAPTEATRALVVASRTGETRRRRLVSGSLAAGIVVAVGLAAASLWQRGLAVEQRGVAEQQRGVAEDQRGIALAQRQRAEQAQGAAETARARAEASAEEARRNAERAEQQTELANRETHRAEQRYGQVSANVASTLLESGSTNAALLLLQRAAEAFTDQDAPDELRIALNRATEKGRKADLNLLPADTVAFDVPLDLLLFDSARNVLRPAFDAGLKTLTGRKGQAPVTAVRQLSGTSRIAVLRSDMTLERFDLRTGELVQLGQFGKPGTAQSLDGSSVVLSETGLVVATTQRDGSETGVIQVIDATDGSMLEAPNTLRLIRVGQASDGKRYVFNAGGDGFLRVERTGLKPAKLDGAAKVDVMYGRCVAGLPQPARTAALKVIRGSDDGFAFFDCRRFGPTALVTITISRSGGYERLDWTVASDGTVSNLRQLVSELTGKRLSDLNLTWAAVEPTSGAIGILSNRDLLVLKDRQLVLGRPHPTAPTVARFMSPESVAVVVPDSRQLIVQRGGEDVSAAVEALEPPVDGEPDDVTAGRHPFLHRGTCVGYDAPLTRSATLPGGTIVQFEAPPGLDWDAQTTRLRVETGNTVKLIELGPMSCLQVSGDGSRLLVVRENAVSIYDLERAIATGSIEAASLGDISGAFGRSGFFVGRDRVVTATRARVLLSRRGADGNWLSEEIYRGESPILYAEPDQDGRRLIILSAGGGGLVEGTVRSTKTGQTWFDLGSEYKMLGAGFQTDGGVVVFHRSVPTQHVSFLPLDRLLAESRQALSLACAPQEAVNPASSPCWSQVLLP